MRLTGVRAERGGMIFLRGAFEEWCAAAIYLDGHYTPNLTLDDIDDWVNDPKQVAGIEIYPEASTPPQFQPGLSGCGRVVIWTK